MFSDRVNACTRCTGCLPTLNTDRKVVCRVSGNPVGGVFILGEAPGREEEQMLLPFVGRSGKLLDTYLASAKITDYYITNTIKCRPENNADPSPEQKNNCSSFLIEQIIKVRPRIIITLGRHALSSLSLIGTIDNNTFTLKDNSYSCLTENTYHPAYLLYNGNNPVLQEKYSNFFNSVGEKCRL